MQGSDFQGSRLIGYILGACTAIGILVSVAGIVYFVIWCINHVKII